MIHSKGERFGCFKSRPIEVKPGSFKQNVRKARFYLINNFLNTNNILENVMSGFTPHHSTEVTL